jgi:hypothetical protein
MSDRNYIIPYNLKDSPLRNAEALGKGARMLNFSFLSVKFGLAHNLTKTLLSLSLSKLCVFAVHELFRLAKNLGEKYARFGL